MTPRECDLMSLNTYTPTEGDVLKHPQMPIYVVIDRVTENVYFRCVDDAMGLNDARQMPIAQFLEAFEREHAQPALARKG